MGHPGIRLPVGESSKKQVAIVDILHCSPGKCLPVSACHAIEAAVPRVTCSQQTMVWYGWKTPMPPNHAARLLESPEADPLAAAVEKARRDVRVGLVFQSSPLPQGGQ